MSDYRSKLLAVSKKGTAKEWTALRGLEVPKDCEKELAKIFEAAKKGNTKHYLLLARELKTQNEKLRDAIGRCLEDDPESRSEYIAFLVLKKDAKKLWEIPSDLSPSVAEIAMDPSFLETVQGRKLVGYLLRFEETRNVIRAQIPFASKELATFYGECYYEALNEIDELTAVARSALYAANEKVAENSKLVLRAALHNRRDVSRKYVDTALEKTYAPLLWRSCSCANGKIRARALGLLGEAFPIVDNELDKAVERQLGVLTKALTDDLPSVRAASCFALESALTRFGALVPPVKIQNCVKDIATSAAKDSASPVVREAAYKAIFAIALTQQDQKLIVQMLKSVAKCALNDTSPKVRALYFKECLKKVPSLAPKLHTPKSLLVRFADDVQHKRLTLADAAMDVLLATKTGAFFFSPRTKTSNELERGQVKTALALSRADLASSRLLYARLVDRKKVDLDKLAKFVNALVTVAASFDDDPPEEEEEQEVVGQKRKKTVPVESTKDLLMAIAAEIGAPLTEKDDRLRSYFSEEVLPQLDGETVDRRRLELAIRDDVEDLTPVDAVAVATATSRDPASWAPKLLAALQEDDPVALHAVNRQLLLEKDMLFATEEYVAVLKQLNCFDRSLHMETLCAAIVLSSKSDKDAADALSLLLDDLLVEYTEKAPTTTTATETRRPQRRRKKNATTAAEGEETMAHVSYAVEAALAAVCGAAKEFGSNCRRVAVAALKKFFVVTQTDLAPALVHLAAKYSKDFYFEDPTVLEDAMKRALLEDQYARASWASSTAALHEGLRHQHLFTDLYDDNFAQCTFNAFDSLSPDFDRRSAFDRVFRPLFTSNLLKNDRLTDFQARCCESGEDS